MRVLLGLAIFCSLILGDAAPTAAALPRRADPTPGPHAKEEARNARAPLRFSPAQTPVVPRRLRASAPDLVPAQPVASLEGPLAVTPASLMPDESVMVQPVALLSAGGPLRREVFGFAPYWQLANSGNWNYSLLSTVAYFGLDVNGDGSFNTATAGWSGWNSQELINMINSAHQAGDRVVVVIKAFDEATINQIVTTPAATQRAITNTINAIASKNLDGVNVDFEGFSSPNFPNIQSGFTNFMTQLSSQVHQRWPSAMVSADTYSGAASWDGGIFNIGALAPVVDAFFVMAYDMVFSNLSGQAGPNAPLNGWTYNDTTVVAQYLAKAPASKVLLGVPYYGYKWSTTSNQPYAATTSGATADTYSGIQDDFSCGLTITRRWDATAESPWAFWFSPASGDPCGGNRNSWRELYYDDATSLGMKYDLVNARGLLGTGMWALGYDGTSPDLWQALRQKFVATVPGAPTAVTARPGNAQAIVTWTPPSWDGGTPITRYTVSAAPGGQVVTTDGSTTTATVTGLTNGGAYTLTVTASNAVGSGPASLPSNSITPTAFPGQYHPIAPARILDTRDGTGSVAGPLGPNQAIDVAVVGRGGVPASGVAAVVMNATATNATQASYLAIYPTGLGRPLASNLNFVARQTVANLVEVAVGAGGKVALYNASGFTDVVFDVSGWVSSVDTTTGTAGEYRGLLPARILDTRDGTGGFAAPLAANQSLDLLVAGQGGVPTGGVAAVVLNVTVTNPTTPSFLTAFSTGNPLPLASNLNFVSGQTVANHAIVQVGSGGKVSFYNAAGQTDVIVDVAGWFTDGSDSTAAGGQYTGRNPVRILDTRSASAVGPGQSILVTVAGVAGVPTAGATAAVLNVTAANPTASSYLTVYPSGASRPLASDLNFVTGQTVPNLVIAKLGSDGRIAVFNAAGSTHLVIDLLGWYR